VCDGMATYASEIWYCLGWIAAYRVSQNTDGDLD